MEKNKIPSFFASFGINKVPAAPFLSKKDYPFMNLLAFIIALWATVLTFNEDVSLSSP
jgi:hypothetical protein